MRLFKKGIVDERVENERNSYMPIAYIIQQIVAVLIVMDILVKGNNPIYIIPSIISIVGITLFIVIRCLFGGIGFIDIFKPKDEFTIIYRNKFFKQGFYISLVLLLVIGMVDMIQLIIVGQKIGIILVMFLLSVLIVLIPSFFLSITFVSKGLIVNNNVSLAVTDKKKSLKKFRLNCLYAWIAYVVVTVIMNRPKTMQQFIFTVAIPAIIFIVGYYPLMRFMIKRSERNANNRTH